VRRLLTSRWWARVCPRPGPSSTRRRRPARR
jgi:hypothetical protein